MSLYFKPSLQGRERPVPRPPCVNGGPTNLISFLKPVAVSTAACSTVRNLDVAGFSQLPAEDGYTR